ncbi:MAG: hypothetical protein QM770_16645 [Tepidisphaeraceae bacterium]
MQVPLNDSDYARLERERRWRPKEMPDSLPASTRRVLIEDRYLIDTRLRLRRITGGEGLTELKFGLKELVNPDDYAHAWMTNLYITSNEFEILRTLPAHAIRKTRYRVRLDEGLRVAIDVFEGPLTGLVIVEGEFDSDASLKGFKAPDWFGKEVTGDIRYTGGWLAEHQKIPE